MLWPNASKNTLSFLSGSILTGKRENLHRLEIHLYIPFLCEIRVWSNVSRKPAGHFFWSVSLLNPLFLYYKTTTSRPPPDLSSLLEEVKSPEDIETSLWAKKFQGHLVSIKYILDRQRFKYA